MDKIPKLSIVTTLYCSAEYIGEFFTRAVESAREYVGDDFEVIFVNDGSPDDSLSLVVELTREFEFVRVIDLSRNFGHHKAMIAGLEHAKGDEVFLIDCDLEEEPELLKQFVETKKSKGCDVVFGVQETRKGDWFERVSGSLFYRLFNVLTGFNFPKNIVTARLMSRRFVNAFLLHTEREISIGGLFFITGYEQVAEVINKGNTSRSTYTLGRKLSVLVNSIASFSSKPLLGIFVLGLVVFSLSFFVSVYYFVYAIANSLPPSGFTSIIISIWFLGGIIISSIGIVGIYIAKIYSEVKRRPNAIVRHVYKAKETLRRD